MPQLYELQRRPQLQRGVVDVKIIKGEETLIIDQRSRWSMATFVEEKLNRLQNSLFNMDVSHQKSSKN